MMERMVCARTVRGPLAGSAHGFEEELVRRGYAPGSVRGRLQQLDDLSRWLECQGLAPDELTPDREDLFLRERRADGNVKWVSPRSMLLPLGYLREAGVVPAPAVRTPEGPVERLLLGYHRYLVSERGCGERTFARLESDVRLFLCERVGQRGLELECLTAADVSDFMVRECSRRSVAGARRLVGVMRPLLRYLHVAGITGTSLAWAVPSVADSRDCTLPRGLHATAVAQLLSSCDRRRAVGRRDYTILMLMVRLGLRAGEVAALRLEDIDWHGGEMLVRGKGNHHERLPLPDDVGTALAAYLRHPRPPDAGRTVFLRVIAPAGALTGMAVNAVVRDACVRVGVPRVGPHQLRHTAATEMLRAGASLSEIAEVLRHRHLTTTVIYAKVDRVALRELAQPWPMAVTTGGAA
jgi:integrase/recombinase XerD